MSAIKEPLVIEITEDAYKQNSVYRPWVETKTSAMAANSATSPAQHPALTVLASFGRGPVTAGLPG